MAYERWEGSAELTGYGAVVAQSYPITMWQRYDDTGERIDLEISQPKETPGQLDASQYAQTIHLRVNAGRTRAEELAVEAVLDQADRIAFATDRRVQVSLGYLQFVSADKEQDEGRTILYMRRWKGPQNLVVVPADILNHMSQHIGDPQSDRACRIVRALRWLRRASLADDEVEDFAVMMMGLDGLKCLLPQPSAKGHGKKKGKGRQPASKQGINAILSNWAVRYCGIAREDWKLVWDLRNNLIHGDLTENADTRSNLAGAIPHLRLALGLALKHVLGLPQNAPPDVSLPPFTATGLQITAPGFTPASDSATHTPDDEAASPDS